MLLTPERLRKIAACNEAEKPSISLKPGERLVRGRGIDDAPDDDSEAKRQWYSLLGRVHRENSLHPSWLRYSTFRDWFNRQIFKEGYILTSILIEPWSRELGPDNSLYVTPDVWFFIKPNYSYKPGSWRGCNLVNARGLWRVTVVFRGKAKQMGRFENPLDAHLLWLAHKIDAGYTVLAEIDRNPALKNAFRNYLKRMEQHLDEGKEFTV